MLAFGVPAKCARDAANPRLLRKLRLIAVNIKRTSRCRNGYRLSGVGIHSCHILFERTPCNNTGILDISYPWWVIGLFFNNDLHVTHQTAHGNTIPELLYQNGYVVNALLFGNSPYDLTCISVNSKIVVRTR